MVLKDYNHIILWLDYFNKTLPRRKGRRIKSERAVFNPTVADALTCQKRPVMTHPQETAEQVVPKIVKFQNRVTLYCQNRQNKKKSTVLECVAEKNGPEELDKNQGKIGE